MITTKTKTNLQQNKPLSIVICLILIFSFVFANPSFSIGKTKAEIEQEKQLKEAQLKELTEQIKQYQEDINAKQKTSNTLKNQIILFDVQIKQTETQVVVSQTKIDITSAKIAELSNTIAEKEGKMIEIKNQIADLVRELYQMDRTNSTIVTLMNNSSFSEFFNDFTKIENIQGKSFELLQNIKILKQELQSEKEKIEAERQELQDFKIDLIQRENILSEQKSTKNELLSLTRGQEAEYKKLLAASEQEESKIQAEIEKLETQLRADLGTPASPGKKGLFFWPMDGILTQRYGNSGFTAMGYTFHNGIDVAAPAGTPIYAAYDGVVLHTGTGKAAYGNWATVKHDLPSGRSVVTLYAHMKTIGVLVGQEVTGGKTLIGTEGNTGYTTRLLYGPERGYHIHFVVFDYKGYKVVPGAYTNIYGPYEIPTGITYNPADFL